MGVPPKIGRLIIYGGELTGMVLVLARCRIEIVIRSVTNSQKMSKIMQNGIFSFFVGVSMAPVNMQTDVGA